MDTIIDTPNNPDLPNLAAVSPWATVQKFATMQVLAAILVNLIMVTGGFLGNQGIGFLAAVPAIALLAFSLREHKGCREPALRRVAGIRRSGSDGPR